MAGKRQDDVAVIIAAWNAETRIERCVRSALQPGVAEVVVVDDASEDDTVGAARRADDGERPDLGGWLAHGRRRYPTPTATAGAAAGVRHNGRP